MFRVVKGLKIGSKNVVGIKCMRGSDVNVFQREGKGKVSKDYMESIGIIMRMEM